MSIPEQAGKVATSAIESLKGSPGLLVLVLLQLATMGILVVLNDRQNVRRQEREMAMLERCFPVKKSAMQEFTTGAIPPKPKENVK